MNLKLSGLTAIGSLILLVSSSLMAEVIFYSSFESYLPGSIQGYVFDDIDEHGLWDGLTVDAMFADRSYPGADHWCKGDGQGLFSCVDLPGQGNSNSFGVALGDLDADGFLDAVFVNGDPNPRADRVCLGDGQGGFICSDLSADAVPSTGVALGFINSDEHLDVVVSRYGFPNLVCLGNGTGEFNCSEVSPDTDSSSGVALGFINDDSHLDAVFVNGGWQINEPDEVCLGDGLGGFACSELSTDVLSSTGVALGEINGDDFLDVVISTLNARNLACLGDGSGGFTCSEIAIYPRNSAGVGLGDFDGDEILDAVFADWGTDRFCKGDGSGGFVCSDIAGATGTDYSYGMTVGDIDADGFLDAVFANYTTTDRKCLGDGSGGFTCSSVTAVTRENGAVALGLLDGSPEPGVFGVMVTLVGDVDGNGSNDTQSTTTNKSGAFQFTGLYPGAYTVTVADREGRVVTTASSFEVTVGPGEAQVAIGGQAILVAGDKRSEVIVGPELLFGHSAGSIRGYTFDDSNGNGTDDGEPRLAAVTVTLTGTDINGALGPVSMTTDVNGEYAFMDLLPGSYTLNMGQRRWWTDTTTDSHLVTLGLGEELVAEAGQANLPPGDALTEVVNSGLAFGKTRPGSIHGYSFEDINGNGQDDVDPRLAGVSLTLTGIDGQGIAVGPLDALTDSNGLFGFEGLFPGAYIVTQDVPASYTATTPTSRNVSVKSGIADVAESGQTMEGDFIDLFFTGPGLLFGIGMTFGPDGNIYVTSNDPGRNELLRYDGTTGAFIDVFSPSSGNFFQDLEFGPDGDLYVTNTNKQVLRFDGTSGALLGVFASGGLNGSSAALIFGPDGNLYVALTSNEVYRFDGSTGAALGVFVSAGSGGLHNPGQMTFGADGRLYVVSTGTDKVLRYDGTSGVFVDAFVSGGGLSWPIGIEFGPDDNLYVSSRNTDQVLRFNGSSGAFIDVFASEGGIDVPGDIVFSASGVLYVRTLTDQVLRYRRPTTEVLNTELKFGNRPPP